MLKRLLLHEKMCPQIESIRSTAADEATIGNDDSLLF